MLIKEEDQLELPGITVRQNPWHLVKRMHVNFGINYDGEPRHLETDEKEFRLVCLREEVAEYEEAETLADELDAIIDLIVFALGTLERHGFPFFRPFMKVMEANLRKKVAKNASASKRNFSIDLVKPEGWEAPDLREFTGE